VEELRIAWVPDTEPRIGITLVPGHTTKGENGKPAPRDLDADLLRTAVALPGPRPSCMFVAPVAIRGGAMGGDR
jgi:hypothetical protein